MNNHDELSYLKIVTRILEEMSKENDKMKREILLHRIIIILLVIIVCFLAYLGVK